MFIWRPIWNEDITRPTGHVEVVSLDKVKCFGLRQLCTKWDVCTMTCMILRYTCTSPTNNFTLRNAMAELTVRSKQRPTHTASVRAWWRLLTIKWLAGQRRRARLFSRQCIATPTDEWLMPIQMHAATSFCPYYALSRPTRPTSRLVLSAMYDIWAVGAVALL